MGIDLGGSLGSLIVRACQRWHGRIALQWPGGAFTYADLGNRISQFIAAYGSLGLARGGALAIMAPNLPETAIANAAAMVAAIRVTPVSLFMPDEDLAYILGDAEIDVILVAPEQAERVALLVMNLGRSIQVATLGAAQQGIDLVARADSAAPSTLESVAQCGDIAVIAYTGGTTGRPKGVVHTHNSTLATVLMAASEWEWPSPTNVVAVTPVSHAAGMLCYPAWLKGGTFHLLPSFDPAGLADYARKHNVTATFLVPTMIYRLIDHAKETELDLGPLETIIYGGAPIAIPRLVEAIELFGPLFMQLYGQTEAPTCIAYLARDQHMLDRPDRLGSCGVPLASVDIQLVDTDGAPVPTGECGEICVRGAFVMQGYWRREAATVEAIRDGWLRTGDVGRFDEDGYLSIVDRTKDMIITGGFNVYPNEIEQVIAIIPGVLACGVVGIDDPRWGEAVTAFIVPNDPANPPDPVQIMRVVRERRGPAAVPKRIEFIAALPVTPIGKIDKKVLRQLPLAAVEGHS
ncbi:AMP-binding protein [Sphingosinicella microcystinivorans]|uniref:Fatty-acid-CoA ligase FadD n=1 Tax=Sphingosinicella microcystinivorans TaxID=335406 RepID=A0AAD1D237_SPHMI|nr:AMP-binding protein [Sphingosinicella microcystinivorans]RKS88697.1 fatty-acyl-CoA synthase [Sphingosinicella microcystinivorans]BBE32451.1 putative fatty-acid-CoA ligase FadD [Sphingosinicella microcystinivorans]